MRDFKKLEVWVKAHKLTLAIYKITAHFPKDERYGIVNQMRRCSSSIGSNIAEGCGRNTESQFVHFLNIAFGSTSELEYQLLLSRDLLFVDSDTHLELDALATEIKKMLWALMESVNQRIHG